MNDLKNSVIFPLGDKVDSKNFIGDTWLKILMEQDEFNCPSYNVTFAPGARNSWHIHPGGQILFVTGGEGWYQEEGKEAQLIKTGDVIKIPHDVKHWHGATKDNWMAHLGITANPQAGDAQWLEPVSDEEYDVLTP